MKDIIEFNMYIKQLLYIHIYGYLKRKDADVTQIISIYLIYHVARESYSLTRRDIYIYIHILYIYIYIHIHMYIYTYMFI